MRKWWMLLLLSLSQALAMSIWFTASAIAPALAARWGLDAQQSAWLTSAVPLGFVAGTALAVLLNLADLWPARAYVAGAALLAASCNALLLWAGGFAPAFLLRFASGLCLAGVYPPAMKMVATWFVARRGLAIGSMVGALVLGKALPYAVRAYDHGHPELVLVAASSAALLAGLLIALLYREGPHAFPRPRFAWDLARRAVAERRTRLAIGGYLGHMWELYAMWAWIPVFLASSLQARGWSSSASALVAAAVIAVGGLGSALGGVVADRIGRGAWVAFCLVLSGSCSLGIGFLYGSTPALLIPLCLVWGVFVVADSAQLSAMVTESCPSEAVGTALTLQTSSGFLLTMLTIQILPRVQTSLGWGFAFAFLAIGPAFGIWCSLQYAFDERVAHRRLQS